MIPSTSYLYGWKPRSDLVEIVIVPRWMRRSPYPRSIATSRRVRLTVRDVGVGLDAQSMRAFDAFYTTKTDGMGIGPW
jgi:signal transduction histidine kinase